MYSIYIYIYMVQSKNRKRNKRKKRGKRGGYYKRPRAIEGSFFSVKQYANSLPPEYFQKFKSYETILYKLKLLVTKAHPVLQEINPSYLIRRWNEYLSLNRFEMLPDLPNQITLLPYELRDSAARYWNKGKTENVGSVSEHAYRDVSYSMPNIMPFRSSNNSGFLSNLRRNVRRTGRGQQDIGCEPGTFRMSGSFEEGAPCEKVGPNTRWPSYNPNTGRHDPNLMNVPDPNDFMSELPNAEVIGSVEGNGQKTGSSVRARIRNLFRNPRQIRAAAAEARAEDLPLAGDVVPVNNTSNTIPSRPISPRRRMGLTSSQLSANAAMARRSMAQRENIIAQQDRAYAEGLRKDRERESAEKIQKLMRRRVQSKRKKRQNFRNSRISTFENKFAQKLLQGQRKKRHEIARARLYGEVKRQNTSRRNNKARQNAAKRIQTIQRRRMAQRNTQKLRNNRARRNVNTRRNLAAAAAEKRTRRPSYQVLSTGMRAPPPPLGSPTVNARQNAARRIQALQRRKMAQRKTQKLRNNKARRNAITRRRKLAAAAAEKRAATPQKITRNIKMGETKYRKRKPVRKTFNIPQKQVNISRVAPPPRARRSSLLGPKPTRAPPPPPNRPPLFRSKRTRRASTPSFRQIPSKTRTRRRSFPPPPKLGGGKRTRRRR